MHGHSEMRPHPNPPPTEEGIYQAVVIGASAGGMRALKILLAGLPAAFPAPIAVVQHIEEHSDAYLAEYLDRVSALAVKEAEDKERLTPGTAYLAPAGYHLLIEPDGSFSLSVDEKVNYCRPSIDLLFESAADAFGEHLIGIILTGANADGAQGMKRIKENGGIAIAQNPKTAESPYMPQAAIHAAPVDHILDVEKIAPLLINGKESLCHRHERLNHCRLRHCRRRRPSPIS